MDVIYGLIPGMLILGLVGVAIFFWAAKSGQFEDLEGEANRILMDEDLTETRTEIKSSPAEDEEATDGTPHKTDKPADSA
ncbi:cbb3-type cytochrome oxidase assembly protein CcoS [Sedimenticola hydrogenitrophicus]|uniref:cbb3-type cytochrome oxidase assembly protein CcoS n=1 Tax=Sedimenticola hydrogenitrophicus TaxID=2967975 RepID=UPI0023AF1964|nr:cbb3-type cytochrome oxidase assembly protein CcoS [Sedimenticola hydrogenitrophicus]